MKLTRKTDYALRLLVYLASKPEGKPVPVREVASKEELSSRFLQGVVSDLVKAEILESFPGPTGGVCLHGKAETLNFRQVFEAIEGPVSLMGCLSDSTFCESQPSCSIQHVLFEAQMAMMQVLEKYTVGRFSEQ